MNFFSTSGAPLVKTLYVLTELSVMRQIADIRFKLDSNIYFLICTIWIPGPEDVLDPSAAYLKLIPSKACLSIGSPTSLPSGTAKVWHPAKIVAAILSVCSTLSRGTTSALVLPIPVIPLIVKSHWVKVPVLSKQQMSTLPAKGMRKGSVQKSCF